MSTTSTTENVRLLQKHMEALNEQDLTALLELHTEDAVIHGASEDYVGLEGIERWARNQVERFPDLTVRGEDMVVADEKVAARVTLTGTHEGAFLGIEPTGQEVEISAIGMFRFEDGKVAEVWFESDQLGALQQLGVIESPGD